MSVNKIIDFIFENFIRELDFPRKAVIIQRKACIKKYIVACK